MEKDQRVTKFNPGVLQHFVAAIESAGEILRMNILEQITGPPEAPWRHFVSECYVKSVVVTDMFDLGLNYC